MGQPTQVPGIQVAEGSLVDTLQRNGEQLKRLKRTIQEIEGILFTPRPASIAEESIADRQRDIAEDLASEHMSLIEQVVQATDEIVSRLR